MADFCRQCSLDLFGQDAGDLRGLGGKDDKPLEPGEGYLVICEGCGPTLVNKDGECIAEDCLEALADSHALYKKEGT